MLFKIALISALLTTSMGVSGEQTPMLYQLVAKEHNIPSKLFFALILNESKTLVKVKNQKITLPWPWTINHKGKAFYFSSKGEALLFAEELIASGYNNFDIGLGQINWKWHGTKFKNVAEALEPYKNLTVSAEFLREQFEREECSNWTLAVGCYHRPRQTAKDKLIAEKYTTRVIEIWQSI